MVSRADGGAHGSDSFAGAGKLAGASGRVTGSNVGATVELKEPAIPGGGDNSIWWNWTAASTGTVTVDTRGSTFDTVLGVYTGTDLGTLILVVSDDDGAGGGQSEAGFVAQAGTTYRFTVRGFDLGAGGSAEGNVVLNWTLVSIANDQFTSAIELSIGGGRTTGTNVGATVEDKEPRPANAGANSVWWRWEAPFTGTATFDTLGSDFDTVLAVYSGDSVVNLNLVAADNDAAGGIGLSRVSFFAVPGTTYRIAVSGDASGASGSIVLNWTLVNIANDQFASAIELSGGGGSTTGTNVGATVQDMEQRPANAGANSVWWRWQAPFTGMATFDTLGSDFDTVLAVYSGDSVVNLNLVAADNDAAGGIGLSRVSFLAAQGTIYRIAVSGDASGASGSIVLNWTQASIANDQFASAIELSGAGGRTTGTNVGATVEDKEPRPANAGANSVWWRWEAPFTGTATFDTLGSDFDTVLAVYSGDSVLNLNLVAADNDAAGGIGLSRVSFLAVPGTTYRIAVSGDASGASGSIVLNWVIAIPDLSSAVMIEGLPPELLPAQQQPVRIRLGSAFPLPIDGQLSITFSPNAVNPGDDESIQFVSGGRSVDFMIPANQRDAVFPNGGNSIQFQSGTVAGTITLNVSLQTLGQDITPSPPPRALTRLDRRAPFLAEASFAGSQSTFQITATGFSTPRDVQRAAFVFSPRVGGGGILQTFTLSVDVSSAFATWYNSDASGQFGSQFRLTVPFTVSNGTIGAISSATVTLSNALGSSQTLTVNFPSAP